MSSTVDRIKSRLGIADVVSLYVKLEKAGRNYKARCPFHNEKTPSFFVSPERESYHCFGCSRGGDIFSFVEEMEGVTFPEALKILAERAGVAIERYRKSDTSEREKICNILDIARAYYEENLKKIQDARDYLAKRGLSEEVAARFHVGYALPRWDGLAKFLEGRHVPLSDAERAGLLIRSGRDRKEGSYYDRFRGRIMFALHDHLGRMVGYSGRVFPENDREAKYINTPQTLVYDKSDVLYGLSYAKDSIRKSNSAVLVEGQTDVLLSHEARIENVVAVSGTAFSERHLGRLRRLADTLIMAFDADTAGRTALLRACAAALPLGFEVKVASFGKWKDPADFIRNEKNEAWAFRVREARDVFTHVLERLPGEESHQAYSVRIEQEVLPLVACIQNRIRQAHVVQVVASALRVPDFAVYDELAKHVARGGEEGTGVVDAPAATPIDVKQNRKQRITDKLLGLLFWQESEPDTETERERLVVKLEALLGKDEFRGMCARTDVHKRSQLVFEAEVWYKDGERDASHDADELFFNLEEELLKEGLAGAIERLREAERTDDNEKVEAELSRCKALSESLAQLKQRYKKI